MSVGAYRIGDALPEPSGRPFTDPAASMSGENFPVAPGVLPRRLREHLVAVYRYARFVDDLGDEAAADSRTDLLDEVSADIHRLYAGHAPTLPVVRGLRRTVVECALPADPLLALVEANVVDQKVTRYETFEDLLDYCMLSANPVGRIVLHVVDRATPERLELSDRICTGLQLLEHWQDVAEDFADPAKGRVYLPQEDLRRFGVTEHELAAAAASPQLRALLAFETDRALAWLDSGAPLVSTLRGWGRLAVSGYVAGGRAAAAELRRCGYDPLTRVPKPRKSHIARAWLTATVRWPG
ncbi:MAG TPA: squalene synthase HpnC [Segeticoccus sp.]|uniref:squalene synthase HpnC n=1 Tax=Segeticoccus sp. TaxID=2706531 RepID=UPI002D7F694C|nr:squalene synthase HpnC [Segeticoccus sp.]HET8600772.1 squalene synthase HpnC [Segeticoccus sp.]